MDEADAVIAKMSEGDDDEAVLGELLDDGDEGAPVDRAEFRRVVRTLQAHAGPLPRPKDLAEYDKIIPNGADRIMAMAEREQEHRHQWETNQQGLVDKVSDQEHEVTQSGQRFGLFIALCVLVTGLLFLYADHPKVGGTIICSVVVALTGVFVLGRAKPGSNELPQEMPPVVDDDEKPSVNGKPKGELE